MQLHTLLCDALYKNTFLHAIPGSFCGLSSYLYPQQRFAYECSVYRALRSTEDLQKKESHLIVALVPSPSTAPLRLLLLEGLPKLGAAPFFSSSKKASATAPTLR
jgi:hypothetical protein